MKTWITKLKAVWGRGLPVQLPALLLAAAVLTVMLCSAFYLALGAGHDCIGDGCAICCQIAVCRNVLKKLSLSVCAAAFAVAFTYTLCRDVSACTDYAQSYTLVSLKVKLSD